MLIDGSEDTCPVSDRTAARDRKSMSVPVRERMIYRAELKKIGAGGLRL